MNFAGSLDANGRASAQIRIPNNSLLVGTRVFTAYASLDPQAPSGVRSLSNSVLLQIAR